MFNELYVTGVINCIVKQDYSYLYAVIITLDFIIDTNYEGILRKFT